jgi:hypothetical protein
MTMKRGVFLAVDGVGEDRGDLVAGEGADFPARHSGGDLGLPFAAGHDGIGHREERLTRLGDEVVGEVRLDPSDGFEGEFQVGRDEGTGLFEEFGALLFGVGQELLLLEGEGHFRALGPISRVYFDGNLGLATRLESAANGDIRDGMGREKR